MWIREGGIWSFK